ncbi:FtsW/RodA/SpoVE family cell cycle protein [Persicobacter psychrovividus]|uniref:Probable peptidoglycan glycosyltransferase FtsW n=1 Tax=Persicobacter psychrovividus TaxID=387638 RepID=A0ABM7VEQ7_9BACT|nr:cell division protein FtsW [Persicobacter psychrovividus]
MKLLKRISSKLLYYENWRISGDPYILGCVLFWTFVSILSVYSATGTLAFKKMHGNTEHYLYSHGLKFIFGLGAMYIFHRFDYRWFRKVNGLLYIFSIAFLILGQVIGSSLNEAKRWVSIFGVTVQPADFAKLALLIFLSAMLARHQNQAESKGSWPFTIKFLIFSLIPVGLIGLSDISTAMMVLMTVGVMMIVGRVPLMKPFLICCVVIPMAVTIVYAFGSRGNTAISRVEKYWEAVHDPTQASFQSKMGYVAIGNGGVTGLGPGNSEQKNFLPHPYSDFIFAIIIEEYGLFGAFLVIAVYLLFLWRCFAQITYTQQPFGGLLSAGIGFSIVFQAFLNMGVTVGLLPVTGLPLPMISMGGSSLLFIGASIGIVLGVSRSAETPDFEVEEGDTEEQKTAPVRMGSKKFSMRT